MKKTLKIALLAVLMIAMIVTLTGCGKDESKADKEDAKKSDAVTDAGADVVVGTKMDSEEWTDGETIEYEEKIEAYFKNDTIYKAVVTYTFENSDIAEKFVDTYNTMLDMMKEYSEEDEAIYPELKLSGKSASMELSKEYIEENSADDEELTKEGFIQSLEDEGYTVK